MNSILLGVTGGIAAYKAVEVARRLKLLGFEVKAAMTEHATRLVGPETFRAITCNPVAVSLFAGGGEPMRHIALAREADLVIVAPATANIIAKMAHGLADDLLSTTLLATRSPLLVAPAMNLEMCRHPAVRANLETLEKRGVRIVGPESGSLACGEEGEGRMSEPESIVNAAVEMLGLAGSLRGRRVLVTAGGTREPIDPVRYIGNRSSGRMGYALAVAARRMGAEVTLVSGPSALQGPPGVEVVRVETAREMGEEMKARAPACNVVISAAAVADFTPAARSVEKIKRAGRDGLTIELKPTEDILKRLAEVRKPGQVLVGFAAETGELKRRAREKMRDKGIDLIVANDVSLPGSGFDSDDNKATLLFAHGAERELDLMPKTELAACILQAVLELLE